MQRKSNRYTLDLINAPPNTVAWVEALLDDITESISNVPECEAVLTVTALEVCDEDQE